MVGLWERRTEVTSIEAGWLSGLIWSLSSSYTDTQTTQWHTQERMLLVLRAGYVVEAGGGNRQGYPEEEMPPEWGDL
jgi:hypothetical protein